ncbi:MAG: alpha/beta fold hydrolase, partial [Cellulosilyticaceae bacterium]
MKKTEFTLQALMDKHEIYTYKWESTNEPKAIIQIIHGAGEYANRYDTFAKALVQRGFVVYAHDHRGHGKSVKNDEVFGYFGEKDGFQLLVKDTYEVTKHIKQEYPSKKLIILGHSMGSFVARYFSILYSNEIDGLIIVGTGNNSKLELKLGKLVSNL